MTESVQALRSRLGLSSKLKTQLSRLDQKNNIAPSEEGQLKSIGLLRRPDRFPTSTRDPRPTSCISNGGKLTE